MAKVYSVSILIICDPAIGCRATPNTIGGVTGGNPKLEKGDKIRFVVEDENLVATIFNPHDTISSHNYMTVTKKNSPRYFKLKDDANLGQFPLAIHCNICGWACPGPGPGPAPTMIIE
ncbi:MAG TPA: hypothetical protein VKP65_15635 [Rhodothermales bacterium]|nr:hypothetical protein [Rhodothermales bacterium]